MFVLSFIGNAQISVNEGFEAATLPTGWTLQTDAANTNVGLSTNNPITGSRSFAFNFGAIGYGTLITAAYTSNGAAIQVSFKSKDSHDFLYVDYQLYYVAGSAGGVLADGGTGPRAANSAVVTNNFSIPAGTIASGTQVRFWIVCSRIGTNGPALFVDDFIIDQTGGASASGPIAFSNVTSSAITNTTATVGVTLANVCAGATYNLQYSQNSNFSIPTLNVNNLSAGAAGVKTHNLTGLETGSTYYFRFYVSPNQACNTSEIISSVSSFTAISGSTVSAPTAASPQYVCPYQTYSVLIANGTGLKWYQQATGGTEMSDGTILGTLTYYVSQTVNGNESPRTAVAVIVNPTPAMPSAQTQFLCQGAGTTFSDIVTTGTNIRWYTSYQAQYGVEIPAGNVISTGKGYYFTQTVNGCESARAFVNILLSTPTYTNFASIPPVCFGQSFSPLLTTSLNGVTGTWSPAFDSQVTTTYTFTPTPGLCATTVTRTVVVGGIKTWSGSPASWSPSAPTSADVAIISADYNASTALNACSLLVDNNAVVNIPAGTQISLNNEITVSPGSSFTINSNAVLLQKFAVANSGNITFLRESAPLYRQDYTLWSSPVVDQNLRSFSPQTVFNRFYSYNEVTNSYAQELFTATDIATKNFTSGLGYLIRMPNNWPTYVGPGIGGTNFTGSFKGVPTNGDITVPLSITDQKYNLIGNPYPSPINIGTFFVDNPNLHQNIYFWRKRNGASGSGFAIWSPMGFVITQPDYSAITDIFNRISSGQGFFVRSNTATSVNFNNNQRENYQGYFFKGSNTATNSDETSRIWLNLEKDQEQVGQMLVGYTSAATNGVDDFDAPYFNDSELALTSLIGADEYSIQSRTSFATSDVVPLGFKSDVASSFSISLSNFDGLFESDQPVVLKDNLTGIQLDLKTAAYIFSSDSGIFNDRFELRFGSTLSNSDVVSTENYININAKNDVINIAANRTIEQIQVYDLSGRMLFEKKNLNSNTFAINNVNVAQQVLLVKITTNENEMVTKKIIF